MKISEILTETNNRIMPDGEEWDEYNVINCDCLTTDGEICNTPIDYNYGDIPCPNPECTGEVAMSYSRGSSGQTR